MNNLVRRPKTSYYSKQVTRNISAVDNRYKQELESQQDTFRGVISIKEGPTTQVQQIPSQSQLPASDCMSQVVQ